MTDQNHTATYSPEDNKLRLYAASWLSDEEYQALKAAGFRWAPKQELFVAPAWTPAREDILLEMCGEIEDEDMSPEDRAADRAERFAGYRDKRRGEAHGHADTFEAGPAVHGYQNQDKAERAARKHDRQRLYALSQWSKAEYWQHRTAGVISHALHLSDPRTRRGRILRLEAEQRKHLAGVEAAQERYDAWQQVLTLPGLDETLSRDDEGRIGTASEALKLAYRLANTGGGYYYAHPRTGRESSLYSHLTNREDPITAREAADLAIGGRERPTSGRWAAHYKLRLAYERQMLEAEGGTAGNVEMEPGGFFGGMLIVKVNKSNTTGAVVSVNVHSPDDGQWDYRRRGNTLLINVQRSGKRTYTPPTDESRAQLAEITKAKKAKAKAKNAGKPKLLNPTNEDAERLQAELNRLAYERRRAGEGKYTTSEEMRPTPVAYMTQAEYSARSKGTYARYETATLHAGPSLDAGRTLRRPKAPAVCKVRIGPRQDFTRPSSTPGILNVVGRTEAPAVVVLTDKPQKPLPDWSKRPAEATTEAEKVAAN